MREEGGEQEEDKTNTDNCERERNGCENACIKEQSDPINSTTQTESERHTDPKTLPLETDRLRLTAEGGEQDQD